MKDKKLDKVVVDGVGRWCRTRGKGVQEGYFS